MVNQWIWDWFPRPWYEIFMYCSVYLSTLSSIYVPVYCSDNLSDVVSMCLPVLVLSIALFFHQFICLLINLSIYIIYTQYLKKRKTREHIAFTPKWREGNTAQRKYVPIWAGKVDSRRSLLLSLNLFNSVSYSLIFHFHQNGL